MSKRTILIAVGVLAVAGGAAAIAAVGDREQGFGPRMAQMWGHGGGEHMGRGPGGRRGGGGDDGMGMGMGMGMGLPGEGRDGMMGKGPRGGRAFTKDEFDARIRERFARFDKNGDGVLDRAEIEGQMAAMGPGARGRDAAAPAGGGAAGPGQSGGPMQQRFLRRFDADNDGKLTRDEFQAGVRRMFTRFDLDGDGRITDADLPPMMRGTGVLKGEGGFGRGMGSGGGMLGRLIAADTNKDGVITVDEAVTAATARFVQFDRTKDGVVEQADFEQLRKEMLDYRVQRFVHRFGGTDGRVTRDQFAAVAAEQFKLLDGNNDGRVDRQDRREGMRGRWGHR